MEARLRNQGQTTFFPGLGHPGLRHPIFDSVRPWLQRLPMAGWPGHEALNALAEETGLATESGHAVRFVPPASAGRYYEISVYETGRVHTRPGNWHDLFNALAWLAFPKVKARLNALHASDMANEHGQRGRRRDMLTIFDEGGALVAASHFLVESLIRECRWHDLFWVRRQRLAAELRVAVVGHAVLEQALAPRPEITCKVLFVSPDRDLDAQAAEALGEHATPRTLPPLPVFGLPGWHPGNRVEAFYRDERHFRPLRRDAAVR